MRQYQSNIVFQHAVFIEMVHGCIDHNDFSFTKFSKLYLTKHIAGIVRVSALHMPNAYWDIEKKINDVVDYVNNAG